MRVSPLKTSATRSSSAAFRLRGAGSPVPAPRLLPSTYVSRASEPAARRRARSSRLRTAAGRPRAATDRARAAPRGRAARAATAWSRRAGSVRRGDESGGRRRSTGRSRERSRRARWSCGAADAACPAAYGSSGRSASECGTEAGAFDLHQHDHDQRDRDQDLGDVEEVGELHLDPRVEAATPPEQPGGARYSVAATAAGAETRRSRS